MYLHFSSLPIFPLSTNFLYSFMLLSIFLRILIHIFFYCNFKVRRRLWFWQLWKSQQLENWGGSRFSWQTWWRHQACELIDNFRHWYDLYQRVPTSSSNYWLKRRHWNQSHYHVSSCNKNGFYCPSLLLWSLLYFRGRAFEGVEGRVFLWFLWLELPRYGFQWQVKQELLMEVDIWENQIEEEGKSEDNEEIVEVPVADKVDSMSIKNGRVVKFSILEVNHSD